MGDTKRYKMAIHARATYWNSIGEGERADADPSPDSLAAWLDVIDAVVDSWWKLPAQEEN